jgi:hypothetical protein
MRIETDTPPFKRCGCKRKVSWIAVGAAHAHTSGNAVVKKWWMYPSFYTHTLLSIRVGSVHVH